MSRTDAIEVRIHATPAAFLAAAAPAVMAEEALNSLMLGIAESLREGRMHGDTAPFLATLHRDGTTVGAALRTPPWHLLLSRLDPGASDALVDWLASRGDELSGVNAETAVAQRFAERFAERTGKHTHVITRMRLFELRDVIALPAPPGRMRPATAADHELVLAWYEAFQAEALPEAPARMPFEGHLQAGRIHLWVDHADRPLALATRNREQPTGASIGPVYTPPALRGHGYATALVGALSRAILDEGKRYVCLFTDLANPIANAIYPRVGYHPIADTSVWVFD